MVRLSIGREEYDSMQSQLWAAHSLVLDYVACKYQSQLGITEEFDECTEHDHLLPPGVTRMRPSLNNERGVAVFWQSDVPMLRRFLAPGGGIEDLLTQIRPILQQHAHFPDTLELFTVENEYPLFPYTEGDAKGYSINVRYKAWREHQATTTQPRS